MRVAIWLRQGRREKFRSKARGSSLSIGKSRISQKRRFMMVGSQLAISQLRKTESIASSAETAWILLRLEVTRYQLWKSKRCFAPIQMLKNAQSLESKTSNGESGFVPH